MPERFKPAARTIGSVFGGVAAPVAAVRGGQPAFAPGSNMRARLGKSPPLALQQTVGASILRKRPAARCRKPPKPAARHEPSTGQATRGTRAALSGTVCRTGSRKVPDLRQKAAPRPMLPSWMRCQKIGDVHAPAAKTCWMRWKAPATPRARPTRRLGSRPGIEDTTPLQIAPLKQDIGEYIGGLTRSAKTKGARGNRQGIRGFWRHESLREIQDWRSTPFDRAARGLQNRGRQRDADPRRDCRPGG